jgi:hypothetical protein
MRLIARIGHRSSGIVDLDGAVVAGHDLSSREAARRTRTEKHEGETDQGEHSSEE